MGQALEARRKVKEVVPLVATYHPQKLARLRSLREKCDSVSHLQNHYLTVKLFETVSRTLLIHFWKLHMLAESCRESGLPTLQAIQALLLQFWTETAVFLFQVQIMHLLMQQATSHLTLLDG
jgi:hypothetical protein